MTEKEVRDIVKGVIKSEVSDFLKKPQIEKIAKEEASKVMKDVLTQKDVKDIVRKMIIAQYKYLWEKSSFFINQI